MNRKIFRNIGTLLTLEGAALKQGRKIQESDLGILKKAAFVTENGRISWIGSDKKIPKIKGAKEVNLEGQTILPGFVECHTHLVFAGNRYQEFEEKNRGVSYQEIAARGGGILHTMRETRKASKAQLLKTSQTRADHFVRQGVTTLEAKSGYALNLKDEIKCLELIKSLKGPRLIGTFLGAHALPPEFKTTDEYLLFLEKEVLPVVRKKKLAERADIFIEKGFFERDSAKKYLQKARELGFEITIHADQLSLSGGSDLAVEMRALSADHVLQLDETTLKKIARSETTAVLLPLADLYMKCAYPKARQLIDEGARVALATDFNPGSAPSQDLSLVGVLARLEMKMSLPEVIAAYTVGGAHALNLQNEVGSLERGKSADFISISQDWDSLFYSVGLHEVKKTYLKSNLIRI